MSRWLVVLLIAGCVGGSPGLPDAGGTIEPPPQCPPLPALEGFDFYGETCAAAPSPALTICHDAGDQPATWGWCVGNVCRPQSGSPCPRCPAGTVRTSTDGARYCAP